jgi:hypothetical protein
MGALTVHRSKEGNTGKYENMGMLADRPLLGVVTYPENKPTGYIEQ